MFSLNERLLGPRIQTYIVHVEEIMDHRWYNSTMAILSVYFLWRACTWGGGFTIQSSTWRTWRVKGMHIWVNCSGGSRPVYLGGPASSLMLRHRVIHSGDTQTIITVSLSPTSTDYLSFLDSWIIHAYHSPTLCKLWNLSFLNHHLNCLNYQR